jgi:hypothetical protein
LSKAVLKGIYPNRYQEKHNKYTTLKDEEYTSGSKYYDMPGVNAIDYEMNQDSHILQNKHVDAFGELVRSFGVTFT